MTNEEEPQNTIFFHNSILSRSRSRSSFSFSNSSIIIKNNNYSIFGSDNYSNVVFSEEGMFVIIGMLVLLIVLVFIAYKCKPWHSLFVSSSASSRSRTFKADDLKRPLVSEYPCLFQIHGNDFARTRDPEGAGHQSQGGLTSPGGHELASKQKLLSSLPQLTHSDSFVLDIPDSTEDAFADQTLKHPLVIIQSADEEKLGKKEDTKFGSRFDLDKERSREFAPNNTRVQRGSILKLEVISGPSRGLSYSVESTNPSMLPLTLGRLLPSNVLIKDSEVSAKHALINWNADKSKWELVDVGSLNGTCLNSKAIHHSHPGKRHWGDPVELSSGDIITLGTTSKVSVQIASDTNIQLPFGVGVASDPMALRRGGRKLPMEDVCYYKWPLPGTDQFGVFGICDGHSGAAAAISVSKIMPEMITKILSDSYKREAVLTRSDASDVLREAFSQTEASINHEYEGCTATVLLVWVDGCHENLYAQCANVGDSACFIDIDGQQIKMTEDHRITSYSERLRIQATGQPLRDGETRLFGLNLARVLGDKFLKEQDARFSSKPYISEVACIRQASKAFALLASDGFWDVINVKKAAQLVEQMKEKNLKDHDDSVESVANFLLNEARTKRTKDNTSIMFLDFDSTKRTKNSCKFDP